MTNKDLYNYFIKTDLGKELDQNELDMLLTHNKFVVFNPGDRIIEQGKNSDGIYIIVTGTVIITAKILGEGTTRLETIGPGNYFGGISFIRKAPSTTSCTANSEVQCMVITEAYFDLLSIYFPVTRYKILKSIVKQVCSHMKTLHDKIITFISSSDMAKQSFIGEFIHSLTKPAEITMEEAQVNVGKLKASPSLDQFTQDEITELLEYAKLFQVPKSCTLIHKNEKNAACYLVIHGAVQSSIVHENKIAKLSVIGPAMLFASVSCVEINPAFTITFVTCEKSVLFKISETSLYEIQKSNLSLWYKVFYLICKSIIALEESIVKLNIRLNIETYNR